MRKEKLGSFVKVRLLEHSEKLAEPSGAKDVKLKHTKKTTEEKPITV